MLRKLLNTPKTAKDFFVKNDRHGISRIVKPALGIVFLLILLVELDSEKLSVILLRFKWTWFIAAAVCSLVANALCAVRWSRIARRLEFKIAVRVALAVYFKAVAGNTVLPGGIIGGDIYRVYALGKSKSAYRRAVESVVFDRVSGIWGLAIISIVTLISNFNLMRPIISASILIICYLFVLMFISVLPLICLALRRKMAWVSVDTLFYSLISQALNVATLWLCYMAFGANPGIPALAFSSTLIFILSTFPASVGGFGSRELATVFVMQFFTINSEVSFMASVLFGLLLTLQGMVTILAYLFSKFAKPRISSI